MVDFYGFHVGKYTIFTWILWVMLRCCRFVSKNVALAVSVFYPLILLVGFGEPKPMADLETLLGCWDRQIDESAFPAFPFPLDPCMVYLPTFSIRISQM